MTVPPDYVKTPANAGRCSNPEPKTTISMPPEFDLVCNRCGIRGGDGWPLVSQQSHCNRKLDPTECHLRQGGWSYVYAHNCADLDEQIARTLTKVREMSLDDRLRASVAQFPPSLRRLVDDEPPAAINDPTLPKYPICEYCGPVCYGGAAHNQRVENGDKYEADAFGEGDRISIVIPPAGIVALEELAGIHAAAEETEQKRRQLISSLICAAKKLADDRVRVRHMMDKGSVIYCGECQAEMEPDFLRRAHDHHKSCKTGLVFVILSELSRLPRETAGAEDARVCDACGANDGAWVSEAMSWLQAECYGLAPNQQREDVTGGARIHTHLCPEELAHMDMTGGAA